MHASTALIQAGALSARLWLRTGFSLVCLDAQTPGKAEPESDRQDLAFFGQVFVFDPARWEHLPAMASRGVCAVVGCGPGMGGRRAEKKLHGLMSLSVSSRRKKV